MKLKLKVRGKNDNYLVLLGKGDIARGPTVEENWLVGNSRSTLKIFRDEACSRKRDLKSVTHLQMQPDTSNVCPR